MNKLTKLNKQRRLFTMSAWITPAMVSIVLQKHAQASTTLISVEAQIFASNCVTAELFTSFGVRVRNTREEPIVIEKLDLETMEGSVSVRAADYPFTLPSGNSFDAEVGETTGVRALTAHCQTIWS